MTRTVRPSLLLLIFTAMWIIPNTFAAAQFAGSRGGVTGHQDASAWSLPMLEPETAQAYITIEGQAELRVVPTEIRIVLAVTAEGLTAAECSQQVQSTVSQLKADWTEQKIPADRIVEDFIAVLPRYEFQLQKLDNREAAVEKRIGYMMQSNLHIAVANDAQAMSVIQAAFQRGVTDIIAFDYWSKQLQDVRTKARSEAAKAARTKAESLLAPLFDNMPQIINVQEKTVIVYPESLYESFSNGGDDRYEPSYSARRDIPVIRAFRPRNTYYRGLYLNADLFSDQLPMRSEISVVSTVRLYYRSPAAKTSE